MAEEVFIPKFGQTVEEVTLLQWLAEDGAAVKKGQEILEIETDKTTFSVEAEAAGTLHRGPYAQGQVVPVLTVVAIIGGPDEKFAGAGGASGEAAEMPASSAAAEAAAAASHGLHRLRPSPTGRVFVSPRGAQAGRGARRRSAPTVTPTGGGGVRVAERDVLAYLAAAPKATPWRRSWLRKPASICAP